MEILLYYSLNSSEDKIFDKLESQHDSYAKKFSDIFLKIPEIAMHGVAHSLYELQPKDLKRIIDARRKNIVRVIEIPEELLDIAETSIVLSSSINIGKGELVIPFIFKNAEINTLNTAYDLKVIHNKFPNLFMIIQMSDDILCDFNYLYIK